MAILNIDNLIDKLSLLPNKQGSSVANIEFEQAKHYLLSLLQEYQSADEADKDEIEKRIIRFQFIRSACLAAIDSEKRCEELEPIDIASRLSSFSQDTLGKIIGTLLPNSTVTENYYKLVDAQEKSFQDGLALAKSDTEKKLLLTVAVLKGWHDDVDALMKTHHVSAKEAEILRYSLVTFAIRAGKLPIAKRLIENEPALLNDVDKHGFTPLLISICYPSEGISAFIDFLCNHDQIDLSKKYRDRDAYEWALFLNDALDLIGPKKDVLSAVSSFVSFGRNGHIEQPNSNSLSNLNKKHQSNTLITKKASSI